MSVVRRRAQVYGRVQGVGFRYFCRDAAQETGLRGWVRNRPDGSVELEAEGEAADVAAYLERLRTGHPWARVERIDAMELTARNDPKEDFDIQV